MARPQFFLSVRWRYVASSSTGSNRTVFDLGLSLRLKTPHLGAQGLGFIPVYSAVLDEIERSSRLQTIGIAKGLRMEVFAITAQRRLQHPGVVAMTAKPG